jgi:hypothetical protein
MQSYVNDGDGGPELDDALDSVIHCPRLPDDGIAGVFDEGAQAFPDQLVVVNDVKGYTILLVH